jgi:tRNA/tmRNA/rRNA uracil-C5-methylase (TrmA/RlmC/RlmD family)
MEPILDEQNSPAATAAEPLCPVFGECQGCLYQNIIYTDELKIKEQQLRDLLLASLDISEERFAPIVASPKPYHYRNRLDLKLKRTIEHGILIGFTPVDRRGILPVEECFIADQNISGFIPELKVEAVARLPPKYRLANLVVRTGDDGRVCWGGIGRRSCELAAEDYFWTQIEGKKIFYSLDTFFQANLSILPKLFEEIRSFDLWEAKPVFYDLYGGVGLFGIGLAERCERVIHIEENPSSVKLARYNIDVNRIGNFQIVEGKVEDELPRLLEEDPKKIKVAMIDPPRAGLSPNASKYLAGSKALNFLFYLSCNPESLARDLKGFTQEGWAVEKIIPFDFFPKTKHLETLVLLSV